MADWTLTYVTTADASWAREHRADLDRQAAAALRTVAGRAGRRLLGDPRVTLTRHLDDPTQVVVHVAAPVTPARLELLDRPAAGRWRSADEVLGSIADETGAVVPA